jgi:hypothetical protein
MMRGTRLVFDFSQPAQLVDQGKKNVKSTFTGSEELRSFIYQFAHLQKVSVSELIQRYVIQGLKDDLGSMLPAQASEEMTVGQLLRRS